MWEDVPREANQPPKGPRANRHALPPAPCASPLLPLPLHRVWPPRSTLLFTRLHSVPRDSFPILFFSSLISFFISCSLPARQAPWKSVLSPAERGKRIDQSAAVCAQLPQTSQIPSERICAVSRSLPARTHTFTIFHPHRLTQPLAGLMTCYLSLTTAVSTPRLD